MELKQNFAELATKFAWVRWKNPFELGSKNRKKTCLLNYHFGQFPYFYLSFFENVKILGRYVLYTRYHKSRIIKSWGVAQTSTRLVLDLFLWKYCEFRRRGVKKITSAPQGLKRSRFSWIERSNPLSSTIFFLLIF